MVSPFICRTLKVGSGPLGAVRRALWPPTSRPPWRVLGDVVCAMHRERRIVHARMLAATLAAYSSLLRGRGEGWNRRSRGGLLFHELP